MTILGFILWFAGLGLCILLVISLLKRSAQDYQERIAHHHETKLLDDEMKWLVWRRKRHPNGTKIEM